MKTAQRLADNMRTYRADPSATFPSCWLCSPRPEDALAEMCSPCRTEIHQAIAAEYHMAAILAEFEEAEDAAWTQEHGADLDQFRRDLALARFGRTFGRNSAGGH